MKKKLLLLMLFLTYITSSALATELPPPTFAPLSPAFLEWQQKQQLPQDRGTTSENDDDYNGYIPIPVDLSHLAANPPREDSDTSPLPIRGAAIPSTYDLRDVNGRNYVTSIKSQLPYETCWTFAPLGAMESNYLMQGKSILDLSEMHLAWFAFRNSDNSKAFHNMNSWSFKNVMNHGGNSFYVTALYSRLAGPVDEYEVPYGIQPSKSTPEEYDRILRLRDVYYLSFLDTEPNINTSDSARNIIKKRIMDHGAVVGNYYNNNNSYKKTDSGGTAYYYKSSGITNHAVLIVGWDDNYSKNNFKNNPGIDGAWLIKNSWGNTWNSDNVGDDGYFWISYNQFLSEGSVFIVEDANLAMKAYYYDALGWCGTLNWDEASEVYSANVFKVDRDNETITEVGFYVPDNNVAYEVNVYSGLTSMPSSSPIPSRATPAASVSGAMSYAGYRTVRLNTPVSVAKNSYFSVVVKFKGIHIIPVETAVIGFSNNATIETGSFFSYDGTKWDTGSKVKANACVKAFGVNGEAITGMKPVIRITYPPDAIQGQPYSSYITASGTSPITWSVSSGTLPPGLRLNASTGELSGTPTTKGNYTFSITVTNTNGTSSRTFTMNVYDAITISTTSFTGYVGYTFSNLLRLSQNISTTWSTTSTLPSGLKLNATTGAITGKPTKAGRYTLAITAHSSAGDIPSTVTFNVNPKPTRPKITTSSLTAAIINEDYSQTLQASGTTPITFAAEGLPNGLALNPSTGNISGVATTAGTYTLKVTVNNIATRLEAKAVTKNIKLVVQVHPPVIQNPGELEDAIVGEKYNSVQFVVSTGDEPITWTASGLPTGMTLSKSGLLSGTPKKAGSFNLTLKAKNASGNNSLKVPLTVLQKPEITTKKLANATTDKTYTAKLVAKGNTPITWSVSGLPDTLKFSQGKDGTSATITGTPVEIGTYSVNITASNVVGSVPYKFELVVKGVTPKITASMPKGTAGKVYTGKITTTGTKPIRITYSVNASDLSKLGVSKFEDLGLEFTSNPDGTAQITGQCEKSIKNLPIMFSAVNAVSTTTKRVSLTIAGNKPAFTSSSGSASNIVAATGSEIDPIDFEVTGTPNITFSMNKVSGFILTQTGTRTARLTGKTPTKNGKTNITITASNADGKATKKIVIQAKTTPTINGVSLTAGMLKDSEEFMVVIDDADITDNTSLPAIRASVSAVDTEFRSHEGLDVPAVPGNETMTFGDTRTVEALGNAELDVLDGYVVAVVLPEIEVTESGLYDLEAVLSDEIGSGAKLYWFAFPQNADLSEDDEIAEFYDSDGAEIEEVPEDKIIGVSVWLNEGVIYAPVIAVK